MRRPTKRINVLITAGPTREWMDPVRFLTNSSSGSLGMETARAFRRRSARVTLILGPTHLTPPPGIRVVPVQSALDMFSAVKKSLPKSDIFISAAAVGDWRFARLYKDKMKKKSRKSMRVVMVKNPDILYEAGRIKRKGRTRLALVGFALETENVSARARKKLKEKNLDLIIGNTPTSFSGTMMNPVWIEKGGKTVRYGRMSKKVLAGKIAQWFYGKH